ncbi:MAG: hypothetical protein A2X18_02755 [Bacteroidetes bacterium GWF2_40_14]|nr:MAG: hypothetical protein A2X18_02755 [Bacteroidetes bacterium GWF2_40_14]
MRRFLLLILIGFSTPLLTNAQSVENLRLTRDYRGNLYDILTGISKDLKIRFVYDSTHIGRYKTAFNRYEEKTVGGTLKVMRSAWDMVTLVGKDGYIYIAKDSAHLVHLQQNRHLSTQNVETKHIESRSRMEPVKRNFLLSGEIFDKTNGERIPFASVYIQGTTQGVSTDANGHFALENVPCDTSVIVVSYLGYETREIELVPDKKNNPLTIEIEPQKQEIAEVFIYGRKNDKALQQSTSEHKIKMAPVALKVLPNVGEKDIMRGFQLMPGVSASNEGSSGMYVRGGTPDQNLIVYDGFTVYHVDHLYGFYSAFNSNAIKDVQLYKGGFESKFGGRLSSVTEITGKDGNTKKLSVGAEVSLLSFNGCVEIPIGDKITSLFAYRRSYQGYLYKKISDQNSSTTVSSLPKFGGRTAQANSYFYDINGKVTIKPTDKDIISMSFLNGTDYLDNSPRFGMPKGGFPGGEASGMTIKMDNSDYTEYGNIGGSGRWARKWNEKLTSNLLLGYSNFYSTRDQRRSITFSGENGKGNIKNGILEDNNLIDYSVKSDWKYSFNDQNIVEAGLFGTYYDIAYSYSQNDTTKLLDKSTRSLLAGIYLQDKISFADNKITFTPGFRVNYYSETGKLYMEPRLSASYKISQKISMNLATGYYSQFANRVVREDVMSGNKDFWILSDGKDIPVSSSTHFNLGLNYDLPDYLFSVEAYYKLNHNVTEYTTRFNSRPDSETKVSEQFFTGNGYATGVEFLAQKKAGNFNGWASYTIAEAKNRFLAQSGKYFYANQDVTHEFKAVGIYKIGNFDFSASWIYASGRPYTAPLGAYSMELLDGTTADYFSVSDKNTFRLPAYHRFDISASFRFNMFGGSGQQNSVSFSIFNLYNRNNISSKQFQIVDHTILESGLSYLGITPNLSLTIKF